nr:MATE family efflux transporter [Planktothrix tepida]
MSHLGVVPMAAHTIGMRIKDIGYIFGAGAASMTTVQVAHAIARNDAVGAKEESSLAACWAVIMMEGVSILALVFSPLVIGIFSNDTEVIATTTTILRIHIFYQAGDAIFMIYRAALVGLNDTFYVRNISLLGGWFVMIPVSLLLTSVMSFGVVGAWLKLTLNVLISAIFYAGRFHFKLRDRINN